QRNRVSSRAVQPPHDLRGGAAAARVVRGIARKARCDDEGNEASIRVSPGVAIAVAAANRRFGPPQRIEVLRRERRDQTVVGRHVDQRERAGIVSEGPSLLDRDLPGGEIEYVGGRGEV